jgi:hypothetical protein
MKAATPKGNPVKKRPAAVRIPRSCHRCGRQLRSRTLRESWVVLRQGKVEKTVCLDCTSVQEMADLVIREVSLECGLNVRDGLVYTRPKFTESDDDWRIA